MKTPPPSYAARACLSLRPRFKGTGSGAEHHPASTAMLVGAAGEHVTPAEFARKLTPLARLTSALRVAKSPPPESGQASLSSNRTSPSAVSAAPSSNTPPPLRAALAAMATEPERKRAPPSTATAPPK
eukprot:3934722-Rhodomonas_salina.2